MEGLDFRVYELLQHTQRADELSRKLPDVSKRALAASLERLVKDGRILRNKKNKYGRIEAFGYLAGTFLSTKHRFSFVTPENPENGKDDVFIPPRADGGAWQGDRVLIQLQDTPRRKGETVRREGAVVKILERNRKDIVGTVEKRGRKLFLLTEDGKYPAIELLKDHLEGTKEGEKIAVKIVFWGDDRKHLPPQGVVTQKFGESGSMEASIAAILHENGIFEPFPAEALEQADSISQDVPETELAQRTDLREQLIFTIDGDDAKDFDDAVSLEKLPNGHYLLGVHIADVSNYVTPASPLDAEAYRRGTSVYYPGHVVPMLPLALSNGICSLNPQVDRCAFSAMMELDKEGRRHGAKFMKSLICSKARMTYHKVNQILQGDAALRQEYTALVDTLEGMNALAHTLRRRRMERGALELDIPEAEILTDEDGHATTVEMRARADSEKLIEEFMLLANEAVAEYLFRRDDPTVYRVHENPDPEKLRVFASFARQFGYRVDASKPEDTQQLQTVLNGAKDKPEQRVLPTMLLRSLARARYSDDCIGHYGLQAKYYLHFTSPIRRYPDLVAHRMLYKAITAQEFTNGDRLFCEEAALQATTREQAADNAERDIDKLFMADYMHPFIGQLFDAQVSGVTGFGLFVTLPNLVEGLVRIEDLPGDQYEFDPAKLTMTAARSGKRYAIGTAVRVRLVAASNVTGQIDFTMTDKAEQA